VAARHARLAPRPLGADVTNADVGYRPARPEDNQALHDVFLASVSEVDRRLGSADAVDDSDPAVRAASWTKWRGLFDHLARTADQAWLAEDGAGTVVGYGRSIKRDGVRELTEFFVSPAWQGQGVGGELLRRSFPPDGARHRSIIATLELGALGRYLKTGLAARCLLLYCSSVPHANPVDMDLEVVRVGDDLGELNGIDGQVLGHTREVDHRWLLGAGDRTGFLFRRGDRAVAYGYVGDRSGPVAVLDPADMTAVLAFLETAAAESGVAEVGFWLPSVNQQATAYLLHRGFRIDPFLATFFSDDTEVGLDRYLVTSPPFFI
jgi:GNAT superfamily N-acetyltransferase